jgi:hypothetical protein
MKEHYISKKFGSPALDLIETINEILDDYREQGYDLSLRQLYYQLVSKNIVPNTERSYKNVGSLVADARLAGMIDWNMIKDRGRETIGNSHWNSPKEILESAAYGFRLDRWDNQPNYVEVMVEKQALEGVLLPVCEKMDVRFTANKGYSSASALYETANRFLDHLGEGRGLHIIYLGDHDPSGIDMTRDIEDRMALFLRDDAHHLSVHRIALNMDQVRKFKPPENPAKTTDSRAENYIQKFGRSSWELDALEPSVLARLVEGAIENLIDDVAWEVMVDKEDGYKGDLRIMASRYADE